MELLYETSDGGVNELYHYGVLGMKWGVHRARRKENSNARLARKAIKYDKKSAVREKRAEKAHAKNDLERANKAAVKSAKYAKKAAKFDDKSRKTDSEILKDRYDSKAAKMRYKSAIKNKEGAKLSKLTGYGAKAMKQSIKSDKFEAKAAKARMKMANNTRYINNMNRKTSDLSAKQIEAAEKWLSGWNVKYD